MIEAKGSYVVRLSFVAAMLFVFLLTAGAAVANTGGSESGIKTRASETYGKLPLSFIQNKGQTDSSVRFYERGPGHAVFFTTEGVSLNLVRSEKAVVGSRTEDVRQKPDKLSATKTAASDTVRLRPLNANPNPKIIADAPQESKINYFIGKDATKWKTNIPTYGAVVYKEIYKGIDIKFYGNNRQLEYDIIVSPGADPSTVKLSYEGIKGLKVTDAGDLEITLQSSSLRDEEGSGEDERIIQKRPYIYQEINDRRVEVAGRFILDFPSSNGKGRGEGNFSYGFEVASYNKDYPLIMDPVIVYSTYLGGNGNDGFTGIALDGSGNVYVTGWTVSLNYPTRNQIQGPDSGNFGDAFVTKINAAGNALVYSTFVGGSSYDQGHGIAVDGSGNAYVTGETYSTDFPIQNPIQGVAGGSSDAFVIKINTAGNALVYSTYLGGANSDNGLGIAVDSSGNAYVSGFTTSTNYPTQNPLQAAYGGGSGDAFVTKINTAGNAMVYSTCLGGKKQDGSYSIAVDGLGNAYVTGWTDSPNFPTQNAIQGTYGGGATSSGDAFIAKINPTGSTLVYSTYLGGSGDDQGRGIAVDGLGNAYVTGYTASGDFPTQNAIQGTYGGSGDAFVIKINASGNSVIYSTYLGGSGDDSANGIAVDGSGNVYVTGNTASTDFPNQDPIQSAKGDLQDAFFTKINPSGNSIVFSTYLGGNATDFGLAIAVDSLGNAYVAGETGSTNFPVMNPIQGGWAGDPDTFDAFLTKIGQQAATYTIFGTVSTSAAAAISGVTMTLSGAAANTATTDVAGKYSFTGLGNGSYTVTPSMTGYAFTPANMAVTVNGANVTDQNFTGTVQFDLTVSKAGTGSGKVTSAPAGIDCGVDCAGSYDLNTNVTLTATPDAGSTFAGWSGGGCSGTGTCQAKMDAAKSVTATFTLNSSLYALTVTKSGTGSGTVTSAPAGINCGVDCTESYNLNTNVTLTATPAAGSTFTGWSGAGCSGASTCQAKMDAAKSVTATFTAVAGAAYRLPDTGQTLSYTSTFGEDHNYPVNPLSYTDHHNGTVTDNNTGLMWQQNAEVTTRTWDAAGTYCTTLPLAGYSDWRLPSGRELIGIVNFGAANPAVDAASFPAADYLQRYWSSNPFSPVPAQAWTVDFASGYVANAEKSTGSYVRCVRGQQRSASSFIDAGDGTVVDMTTQLMWKQADGGSMTWEAALGYCEGLSFAGHNDWRLPNIKALEALKDISSFYPAIDTTFFPTTQTQSYWSSTTQHGNTPVAWRVSFYDSSVGILLKTEGTGYARCVRAGQSGSFSMLDLTVTKAGTGSGTVATNRGTLIWNAAVGTAQYLTGTVVTLTSSPLAGSTFTGWSGGGCSGTGTCQITMNAAKSVTATFNLNATTYALTVSKTGTGSGTVTSSPAGINCGADCTEAYNANTIVTLTAAPLAGSTFAGWSGGGCSGTGTCQVTMNAAKTVTATFTLNPVTYTLSVAKAGTGSGTVTSSPSGINCGADCTEAYNANTVVTLTASAATGSAFIGWSGECGGTGTCQVTMNAAKNITATFSVTRALTVAKSGTGSGTVTSSPAGINCGTDCTEAFIANTVVTLTAAPATGSTFTGWSASGCPGTGTCQITMDSPWTVTATFNLSAPQNISVSRVLLKENFAAGLPASWTNADAWTTNATCTRTLASPFVTPWAIADSTCRTTTAETLTTKAFSAKDCTSSELSFTSAAAWNSGNGNGAVAVSADNGSTWTNRLALSTDEAAGWKTIDINEVAASTNAKIKFAYTNSTASGYWAIDNVWVTCMPSALKFTSNNEVQTIMVENTGSLNLVIGSLATGGANAADFSLQNNLCNGQTLLHGDTCSADIKFATSAVGTRNAVLNIPSNDPDTATAVVTLTGTKIAIGDADGNGTMNIVDALFVARSAAGLTVGTFYPAAADVNCDGTVNIVDALFIARKAAGLTVTGWCGL